MKRKFSFAFALVTLVLAAFIAAGPANAQGSSLAGTTWKLIQVERSGGDVRGTADLNVTLVFDNQGHAGGQSTCNSYSGPYQTGANNSLSIGDLISTLRACVDNGLMDLETEYYAALKGVTSYNIGGNTLQLSYNGGVLTYEATTITVGMPQTGFGFADIAHYAIVGVTMVLLGAGFLFWRRATDLA